MKIYTIIGGVNGVGKSSLSGVLSAENTDLGIIIDTDKLTAEQGGDRIKGGKLANVAPTVLKLLGIDIPNKVTTPVSLREVLSAIPKEKSDSNKK